tara:strand:+ start:366 stop:1478 length:1113 start_codon:yes stop_codon:yes gene_type:complete
LQKLDHKIKVSILGATGMVGQRFILLLNNHPWFEVVDIAASENSANKSYKNAVQSKWVMDDPIPENIKNLNLRSVENFNSIPKEVKIVFSAVDLSDKEKTRMFEFKYAKKGYAVISTSSANRESDDVPMLIPEINHEHLDILKVQQKNHHLPNSGFVVVKPNCSIQSYIFVLDALKKANYPIDKVQVTTLQALSGAGYQALSNTKFKNNVVPFINGEEEKTEAEPTKIFGTIKGNKIINNVNLKINATCTRVPIIDGHTAVVSISFSKNKPSIIDFKEILRSYISLPQNLNLPSAPIKPIHILDDKDRPQPKLDLKNDKGMALSIGRIQKDLFFDLRFVGLSHNTLRGAAGGAILNAELLVEKDYISSKS